MYEDPVWALVESEAQLSECEKRKVGAVILDENMHLVSSGHNYNPDGTCCEHPNEATKSSVIHAEEAAIKNANRPLDGCTIFLNYQPCEGCLSLLDLYELDYKVKVTAKRYPNREKEYEQMADENAELRYEEHKGQQTLPEMESNDDDKVNPKHYSEVKGVPSIEFFKSATNKEGYEAYLQLTCMKYLYRLDSKDTAIVNAKKAQWFINKLVESLKIKEE